MLLTVHKLRDIRLLTLEHSSLYRKDYMGECNQETTESILDFYYENGGMSDMMEARSVL